MHFIYFKPLWPFKTSRDITELREYFSKSQWLSIAIQENIMRENMILNAQI